MLKMDQRMKGQKSVKSLLSCVCVCVCVSMHSVTQSHPTLCGSMDCSQPGSSGISSWNCLMEFPRQEYWSGLPFPPLGDLPNPGIIPASFASPALAGLFFTTSPTWETLIVIYLSRIKENLN